jgi:hypothetical protein
MTLDLTDDEKLALVAHLRHALEYDPFPYAPRLDPLRAILANPEIAVTPIAHRLGVSSRTLHRYKCPPHEPRITPAFEIGRSTLQRSSRRPRVETP